MKNAIVAIAALIALALIALETAQAEAPQPYRLIDSSRIELKAELERFHSLMAEHVSSGTEPQVGSVLADVGCNISVTTEDGLQKFIFFDGAMKLDERDVKFKEISEGHSEYQRNPDSKHTFYKSDQYLLDVEITSFISGEVGESNNVTFRIAGPSGIFVGTGVKYCGC